ncbi:MAG: hypothetical protein ACRDD7_06020 [Peptostreptococcaceae bacterium]
MYNFKIDEVVEFLLYGIWARGIIHAKTLDTNNEYIGYLIYSYGKWYRRPESAIRKINK